MNSLKYHFLIFGLFLLVACSESNRHRQEHGSTKETPEEESKLRGPQKKVIVYGSMECNHCHEFRRKLESKGITYEFRDVDENDEHFIELQNLIKSINYKGYVSYPVIDIEGAVFVNPDFRDVENKMFTSIKE